MRPRLTRTTAVWLVLILSIVAAAVFVDATIYEPRFPQLTTYDVAVPNLPASLDGFKIVQLSDIHRRRGVPDSVIKRAVRMANSTNPDAVVLTGDYSGMDPTNIEPCFKMLSKLESRLGAYAVLGNHDHWTGAEAVSESIARHHITLLDNESARLGPGLYLAGIDDQWVGSPDVNAAFRGIPKGSACVMLSHTPVALPLFAGHKGLLVTGHTHGGQVNLPLIPRTRLPGFHNCKCIKGWYEENGILMYVNRGIGMINPPVRFLCRPEVSLYVLHPAKDGEAKVLPRQ